MTSSPPEPLPEALLCDIAERIATSVESWRSVVRHDAEVRSSVRLLATDRYEVWVIGWSPGQGVDFHDHGDAAGALALVEGELVELRPATTGKRGLRRATLATGSVLPLPVGVVHDVVNVSRSRATSIHVYSPPLTSMTRYDALTFEPLTTDVVPAKRTTISTVDSAALLHPATGS